MIYNLGTKKPNFNPEKVWIAESADLIGDVILEPDVSVWFNVTIRGDNEKIIIDDIDYYFSNVIAKNSKTMSECRSLRSNLQNTGTDG